MKTLKTLSAIITVALLSVISLNSNAQVTDAANVTLTANLQTSLSLTLGSTAVTFTFDEVDEYKNGIGDDLSIKHSVEVNSTANWKIDLKANGDLLHSNNTNTLDLAQVGIHASNEGNWGATRTTNNSGEATPIALSLADQTILTNGANTLTNAGDSDDNDFFFYYEMGTMEGAMHGTSMLEENYKRGTYQTTIVYTLSEIL